MKKTVYSVMANSFVKPFEGCALLVLSAEVVEHSKKNEDSDQRELEEKFVRLEVEIPRGYGELSRLRFLVKVAHDELKAGLENLDDEEIFVTFEELEISFIDIRQNVYFRAADYAVVE